MLDRIESIRSTFDLAAALKQVVAVMEKECWSQLDLSSGTATTADLKDEAERLERAATMRAAALAKDLAKLAGFDETALARFVTEQVVKSKSQLEK
jgi:hypothetical protein